MLLVIVRRGESSFQILEYFAADLELLNGSIKKLSIKNQITLGTSITLLSERNCLKYLITEKAVGLSGVPRFTSKTPIFGL